MAMTRRLTSTIGFIGLQATNTIGYIRRLKSRETEYISLVKLTPIALEIGRCALTNRVYPDLLYRAFQTS
jgi:hypothetical protein